MAKRSENAVRLIIPLLEAADMLSVCRQTLMEFVKSGQLPCIHLGRKVFFREVDLLKFIEESMVEYKPVRFR